jgi:hypothetical protein
MPVISRLQLKVPLPEPVNGFSAFGNGTLPFRGSSAGMTLPTQHRRDQPEWKRTRGQHPQWITQPKQ